MNVLSLFDGISCARIALNNLGVNVDKYYASEIDNHSIKVSNNNYPDIIQLGDISNISSSDLPKIDLLIGGSPCQDLSHAKNGEGLKGTKSKLFYEYIRLLKELKPKYFLLENVKNKWGDLMSEYVGVQFLEINSNLFSPQSRPRYYWTNLDFPKLPSKLSDLTMKDIIDENVDNKYFLNKPLLPDFLKSVTIKKSSSKDGIIKGFEIPKKIHNDNERQRRIYLEESKSPTLLARADTTKIYIDNQVRKLSPLECERLQGIPDNYTSICSDTQRYKMIGNGFTVNVIEHLLKGLFVEPSNNKLVKKLNLFDDEVY